jgi:START domain
MRTPQTGLLPHLIASLALAVSIPCWAADPVAGWQPGEKKQGDGYAYQIFSVQREGEPFIRFQVRGTIDAPADVVQRAATRVATDPARAPKGQKRTVLSRDENETVLHTEVELPAMFSDRDVITRGRSSVDPATGVRRIEFTATEYPSVPPKEGVIRLENTGGAWVFAPDGNRRSKVTFESYVDLGGSLPTWLISGQMQSTAAESFQNVAHEALENGPRDAVSAPGPGRIAGP